MSAAQTRRILSVFRSADAEQLAAGLDWYPTALGHAESIARDNRLTVAQGAGIIAALSPQVSWGFNLEWAHEIAEGSIINRGFSLSMGRALMIQRNPDMDPLSILGGNKVRAFYACILSAGITDAVCVDRHAIDIAQGARFSAPNGIGTRLYRETAQAYRSAALRLTVTGEAPYLTAPQLQAITWTTWRARYWAQGAFDPRELDRVPLGAF